MVRIPVEEFNVSNLEDEDVINAWKWFTSFMSEQDWKNRKARIEERVSVTFKELSPSLSVPSEEKVLVVKEDMIGWYLYLVDMAIHELHKYEYFQGARVIPMFKQFGLNLDLLRGIEGVEKKVRDLLRKRPSEADAILFEILTALLWARNGYEVVFLAEEDGKRTPDLIARKGDKTWNIECKRQSKTADYTYRETAKRKKMISYLTDTLIARNILLEIAFHVELEPLPDTFLRDLLEKKLQQTAKAGRIVSSEQVDVDLAFVDIGAINAHLEKFYVKHYSPQMNSLICKKPVDNKAFTSSLYGQMFRVGDGEVNNLYVNEISHAFGVYWTCDSSEAVSAKARDIKKQLYAAMQQFNSDDTAVVHIGMETFDGPAVERERYEKIQNTFEQIDPKNTNLKWIFCSFFQAYSPPDQLFVFDETVNSISRFREKVPLEKKLMIVPEDADTASDIAHWDRPLP